MLQRSWATRAELLAEYENSSEEFELLQLKEKELGARATTAARLRLREKRLINATTTAVRRRLAPSAASPRSRAWRTRTRTRIEIFDAIENLPNKPKQMFDDFRKWARGDYEDQIRAGGRGRGAARCGWRRRFRFFF